MPQATPRPGMRSGAFGFLAMITILASIPLAPPAYSQSGETRGQGLTFGRLIFHPSVTFESQEDDNIFYTSEDLESEKIDSRITLVRPQFVFELPFSRSTLRWWYAPQFRDYSAAQGGSQIVDHYGELEGRFEIGRALTITARDRVIDSVDVRQTFAGGELNGLASSFLHEPELEITTDFGARNGITIIPRYSRFKLEEGGSDGLRLDYETRSLEFRYNYQVTGESTMYAYYDYESSVEERAGSFFTEVDVTTRSTGIGVHRRLNDVVVGAFSAGYASQVFIGPSDSGFNGLVASATSAWQLSELSRLSFTLQRKPYSSIFVNNNYYDSNSIGLQLTRQLGRSAYVKLGAQFRKNTYGDELDIFFVTDPDPGDDLDMDGVVDSFEPFAPSQGVRRRDELLSFDAGIGYQFNAALRCFLGLSTAQRSSNIRSTSGSELIDPFDYDVRRVFFRLEAGWL